MECSGRTKDWCGLNTYLVSPKTVYTDIPAVNFITVQSAISKGPLRFLLAWAVTLCFSGLLVYYTWSHTHSANESLLLTRTNSNMLTSSWPPSRRPDQFMPTPSSHAENLVTQQHIRPSSKHAQHLDPGWLFHTKSTSIYSVCVSLFAYNLFLTKVLPIFRCGFSTFSQIY